MFINYVMMYKYVIYSFSINLKIHVYMKPYPNCYLLILRTSPESYVEKYENKLQKITGQVKGLKNHWYDMIILELIFELHEHWDLKNV